MSAAITEAWAEPRRKPAPKKKRAAKKKRQRKAPTGTITGKTLDTGWETPPWILALVAEYFGGRIPFDVCTTADNPCDAEGFWTKKDDALKRDWPARVWCNPPYGKEMPRWLEKLEEQAARGVEILSLPSASRFEQRGLQLAWQRANALCLIRKRVQFLRHVYRLRCEACSGTLSIPFHGVPSQDYLRAQRNRCPSWKPISKRKRGDLVCEGHVSPYDAEEAREEVDGNPYATFFVGFNADLHAFGRSVGMAGSCHELRPLSPLPDYLERRGQRAVTREEGVRLGLVDHYQVQQELWEAAL